MEIDASDGRIYLSKELRDEYGDHFRLVERGDRLVLVPVADDPLAALREEFEGVEGSVRELRDRAREDAGRCDRIVSSDRPYDEVGDRLALEEQ